MQNNVEQEFLKLKDLCPDPAACFPPSVGVKRRVACWLNHYMCRMALHDSVEHSPQSSRVILSSHDYNRTELMLLAPCRKHPTFSFGAIDSSDLYDIRYTK